ncbi:MAG TPA: TolC family protein [Vicinamibacterales bacterium]|nr:TolC family protein [Vicinamibacterales bacterium]
MKQLITATFIFIATVSSASAQTRLRLPANLFAAGQTIAGQAAVPVPVPVAPDSAGPRVSLTLEDAVKRALENNLDIAVQRINQQTYDVAIASIRSVYSPTVNSVVSSQSAKNASTSTISGAATGLTITNSTLVFNGGLVQEVPWGGGNFSAQLDNRRQSTTSLNATINPQYSPTWSATYTQPLLRDFRIDATRQQLLVTRINQDISDIQLKQTTINTVANVRNAYWDYVFAVQSVEVSRQSLTLAEELLRNNQTKVEIGTMAPIDVVQAQSQAAQQRQVLVTAEGTRRTAEIALKRLIVSGTKDPLWTSTIEPVDRPDFRPEPVDLPAATQRALSTRTDVLQAKKNLEANDVTLRFLENQKLPLVNMQTRYATTGIGGTQLITESDGVNRGKLIGTIPGGYLDALDTLFRNKLPTWSVALNVSYNLGTSAADASVARAKIQQNQIEVQLRQLDLQVTSDVSNAAIGVQNSAERVQAAQAARDLAQQQLDAENSKFGVGMSTNYQVVLAQRDLATAQSNELQAVLAYRRAVVEFERVQQTGTGGNITIISR